MTTESALFFFDFTDPISYLTSLELVSLTGAAGPPVRWLPLETSPPPTPLTVTDDPAFAERWREAGPLAHDLDVALDPPRLVPWTRKAHEFCLHAEASGRGEPARLAVYDRFWTRSQDIGRVDVLVEVAREIGLDVTEAKVVLDVDRYEESVLEARIRATAAAVEHAPALVIGSARLQGFHNRSALGTFLAHD